MGNFLKALLAKNGDLYKKKNYLKQAPGTKYSYSNAGATVTAYIIELLYEMPYSEFEFECGCECECGFGCCDETFQKLKTYTF